MEKIDLKNKVETPVEKKEDGEISQDAHNIIIKETERPDEIHDATATEKAKSEKALQDQKKEKTLKEKIFSLFERNINTVKDKEDLNKMFDADIHDLIYNKSYGSVGVSFSSGKVEKYGKLVKKYDIDNEKVQKILDKMKNLVKEIEENPNSNKVELTREFNSLHTEFAKELQTKKAEKESELEK